MQRIVFQRFEPGISKFRIYTIRPNGTGLRAITKRPATLTRTWSGGEVSVLIWAS